jgi:hypothetical protein
MPGLSLHTVLEHLRRLHGIADAVHRSDRELLRSFVTNNWGLAKLSVYPSHWACVAFR